MDDQVFHDLLNWFMCSDPWTGDLALRGRIQAFLDQEAAVRGFQHWLDAYHAFNTMVRL